MRKFFSLFSKRQTVFFFGLTTLLVGNMHAKVNEQTYSILSPQEFDEKGWPNDAFMVPPIIRDLNAKVIVEIGSWLGASSRVIADALPNDGVMICIDHWLGSSEHQLNYNKTFFDNLFPKFLSNTLQKGFSKKILPLRISSIDAANLLDIQPDLIYLDAAHETSAVYADLKAWWPKLRDGGILCGDDWMWPSVREAIVQFAKENDLVVNPRSDWNAFWYINPKNSNKKTPSKLPLQILSNPSIYSVIKTIPYIDNSDAKLTKQLLDCINIHRPENLIMVEPNNTISLSNVGLSMKTFGKVFLIECFEFHGDNIHLNHSIHPFHQHLSNIALAGLTNTIVPIQMFSMQAAQFTTISAPMIYVNLTSYTENIVDHLTVWKSHLLENGILCGNLGDNSAVQEGISEFAVLNGFSIENMTDGFWVLKK